ncbi:O-succinylhomoserine sulfhydrylase [Nitrosomonas ureae]|uniref:O-succinylhomoserine sulfhydrylase n=1 Tax=Nitrosomonas ureae TaxID=44577 RepID=A0A0S3AG17_9PROT|nr:O-succinylhomoserine sulfhydrylase [Nitrosomonas ureae]ALQ50035.1 O-succinylhomoserine sulfhydrylase [Nitrosomonas ureae]SDU09305.1 O-succinylhomoserine sulfhydrylase [Nitrosomonas ureae]SEP97425.1 O-succinylhomoserine sulfhydrylase [Nitrosomonas ureae]SOD16836.1 O-succinylhomoserine sulfhydrylase [Nitrosomonas ureae]
MSDHLQPETLALHTGIHRSQFNEHSEAMYLTSSFVFDSAAQAAARFSGDEPGNIYSRFTNPTVTAFEERLAVLEGAETCIATSSGMSAILACVMGLLSAGDHIIASRSLFGATVNLFNNILKKFNIETTFVAATDVHSWQAAIQTNTKLFFLETPSNPLTEVSDISALAEIAKKSNLWLVVDNCFCTPVLQKPLELGADIVIHSATKYLDGQGRVLGGAVLGKRDVLMEGGIYGFLRTAGPTLSAFNAWVILKGLETLKIRVETHSRNALQLAQWLESHPNVLRIFYPGLMSHPQYELAKQQQKSGGGIVSFEVKGGKEAAWRVIDSTRLISITANLGDTKSTLTHPATTTHARISQEARDAAGISDGLLRIAVGLESVQDLQTDLARGLAL